jgi:tyrosine-protein phosphatase SIW14
MVSQIRAFGGRRLVVWLLSGPLVLWTAALADDAPAAAVLAKPRDDLPGLTNYAAVSDVLSRGAQPTAEGFAELKRRGVKTVVNLRTFHSDRDLLAGTGLQYVEIPCYAWYAEESNVLKFLKVVEDPRNQPVFVHCQQGADRTGMMAGVYREFEQQWTADDAAKELPNFHFHPIFGEVVTFVQKFDRDATRKKLETTVMPKIDVVK